MLWTPGNEFNFTADNFGATYSDAGFGTNAPGHANANTKGANTAILSAIAEDCYGMAICFAGGATAATIRRQLTDILIDPAGGTSWSVLIANLASCGPSLFSGGYWYYFPIYLKAGTAIGAAHQDLVATTQALRVGIRVYGKPTRPELLRVGSRVETFGAVTATTTGTACTPGTNALGSYSASLGAIDHDMWWWQASGILYNDSNIADSGGVVDVAFSTDGGTTKILAVEHMSYNHNSSEQYGKASFGAGIPYQKAPSGATVYARAAAGAAPETTPTVVAYGCG
jgi:hypothetical protein